MELELPDLVEWNEKWKKEIDDLVGKSDLYITQDDLLLDELENKLQYVPDNEFNDKLRQKDTDEAVLTWQRQEAMIGDNHCLMQKLFRGKRKVN